MSKYQIFVNMMNIGCLSTKKCKYDEPWMSKYQKFVNMMNIECLNTKHL